MNYSDFQEGIYTWLTSMHNRQPDFTFSVRQKASKGSELNYFIGTEKSKYFATTLWTIPVAFPGSSSDMINLRFSWGKDRIGFDISFYQTRNPHDDQNQAALDLISSIKESVRSVLPIDYETDSTKVMQSYSTLYREFDNDKISELIDASWEDVQKIVPIVESGILEIKKKFPEFKAHRITEDEFNTMQDKLERRLKKYSTDEKVGKKLLDMDEGIQSPLDISEEQRTTPLNQIFYGPPGTGKTYRTVSEAVRICNPTFNLNQDRKSIKAEYQRLTELGQIAFTTFHQSTSYEDFVEGIKPQVTEDGISYDVEPGIFKQICQQAKRIEVKTEASVDWDKCSYFKMSLGGKNRSETHQWCLENDVIALGYGGQNDLTSYKKLVNKWKIFRNRFTEENAALVEKSRYQIQAAHTFLRMKKGDVVVVSLGNKIIDAIGVITSDYYYDDDAQIRYTHFRKVTWLAQNLQTPPSRFLAKSISQQTIYEFHTADIKKEALKELNVVNRPAITKNYVLIIDEINRANVSQVFGELITLLEEDKRIGGAEEIRLILPYSKDSETLFGVPDNVYLLCTMNTADKSVEALDAALRRRFSFVEIAPDPNLISQKGVLNELEGGIEYGEDEEIRLDYLLELINTRVEILLDKDHLIGHSYFMQVDSLTGLKKMFTQKIIPLLQEYFYGDQGKLSLVLGEGFCSPKNTSINMDLFATSSYDGIHLVDSKTIYEIKNCMNMSDDQFIAALDLLFNKTKEE